MIKTIIIDDEQNSREIVKTVLENNFKTIKVVDSADNVRSAIASINKHKPDIIFLDVDLPDGTGFDILKSVDYKSMKTIFITAFNEYALQAIKFSACDYLLKPFKTDELITTVNSVIEKHLDEDYSLKLQAILTNISANNPEQVKIVLKTSDKIHLVNINDIIFCTSDNSYTTFNLSNGKRIIVSKAIKKYDEMFRGKGFMRVHQSYLINLNYIQHYDKQEGGMVVMTDSTHIPVSHQQKPLLLKYFESLS